MTPAEWAGYFDSALRVFAFRNKDSLRLQENIAHFMALLCILRLVVPLNEQSGIMLLPLNYLLHVAGIRTVVLLPLRPRKS